MNISELFDLHGRTALITDGSGVLGRVMASGLAQAGARVAVLGRREEPALAVAATIRAEGGEQIKEVSHPRLARTPFRSPQLTLIDVGPDEWRLYWRASAYQRRRRPRVLSDIVQLPLFEAEPIPLAVGSDETSSTKRARAHLSHVEEV